MKNAVSGVVHQNSIQYFNEYLASMNNQSLKNFTLFIFSHRIEYRDIKHTLEKYDELDIVYNQLDSNLSISRSRQRALDCIKERNFDNCIFTDTDDLYHRDYVDFLVRYLSEKHPIVFSDLSIYISDENKLDDYFRKCGVPDEIDINYIFNKNCIGLGHSGIKLDLYEKNHFLFPDDIIAVDWWLYTVLMMRSGCHASFIDNTLMYYRQHGGNIAGFFNLDENKILQGFYVKTLHYKNLMTFNGDYEYHYKDYYNLYNELIADEELRKKYVEHIQFFYKDSMYLWWEYAKPIVEYKE